MKLIQILFYVLFPIPPVVNGADDHSQIAKVFVSQNGNDQWSGQLSSPNAMRTDGPLATLAAAQRKVRSLLHHQSSPIEVIVRGGTYQLDNPLVLTPEDSGRQQMPVVWRSHPGERVILSGGKRIAKWEKLEDTIPGLPQTAEGHVWYADIPQGTHFYSLFDDLGILPQAISGRFYTDAAKQNEQTNRTMHWRGDDLANLSHTDEAILHILPSYAFVYSVLRVESVDEANKRLTVKTPSGFRLHASKLPDPHFQTYYRIANVVEHLDEPGEWVFHSKTGKLYYWPISGEQPGDDVCYPVTSELISFRGNVDQREWVRNITLRGFVLRNTERMLDAEGAQFLMAQWDTFEGKHGVVRLKGAQHIVVENCVVENAGGCGIKSGIYSANNTFRHNIIRNTGLGGISLIGHGPGNIADNNHNVVSHNTISYCGEIHACGIGLLLCGSAHNEIHNNLIHHTANHGIAMIGDGKFPLQPNQYMANSPSRQRAKAQESYTRWEDFKIPADQDAWYHRQSYVHTNGNMVEYNEVHHAAHGDRMSDVNSLYSHGTGRGNVYRRNFVHDMHGVGTNCACRADDWMWFLSVNENVIRDIRGPAFNIKQVNEFVNNVIINCEDACFNFKTDWTPPGQKPLDEPHHGTTVRRNIMVQKSGMITGRNPMLPPFYDAQDEAYLKQPLVENNLLYCPDDPSLAESALERSRALGHDRFSIAADPMFVDFENGDFRFNDGSPAIKAGIKPLIRYGPQQAVGLQKKEFSHVDPGESMAEARAVRRKTIDRGPPIESVKRDLILSISSPTVLETSDPIKVSVLYDVAEKRDIQVVLVRSGIRYGGVRETVEPGRGKVNLELELDRNLEPATGEDYTLVAMVLPVGQSWKESLHLQRVVGVKVK